MDPVQVCWMMQGDPQYAFFPAGTNDEREVTLVPRHERVVAQDVCVWLETGIVRSGSENTDSCILEGHVVGNGPHEVRESVKEEDQSSEARVTFHTPLLDEELLYMPHLDLAPVVLASEIGQGHIRDVLLN